MNIGALIGIMIAIVVGIALIPAIFDTVEQAKENLEENYVEEGSGCDYLVNNSMWIVTTNEGVVYTNIEPQSDNYGGYLVKDACWVDDFGYLHELRSGDGVSVVGLLKER